MDEVALVTLYNTSEMEGRAEKREARRVYTWGMEHAWGLGNQNAHDLYIRRGMELELSE